MRILLVGLLASTGLASPAFAQRAGDNAVRSAEDAFGSTIGNETIGLYSAGSVRGFSPTTAGNFRIEGIYFDRQGLFRHPPYTQSSQVRVGLSAQGYIFPAPTGIVDFRLHRAGDERVLSVIGGMQAYGGAFAELDTKLPLVKGKLGVAIEGAYAYDEYMDGGDAPILRAAIVPRWRPTPNVEIMPIVGVSWTFDEETLPAIRTAGDFLPPKIEDSRTFFPQRWAVKDTSTYLYGVVGKGQIGSSWSVAGGVFRSGYEASRAFANLYTGTTRQGITREILVADPRSIAASTSGEVRVSRSFTEGERLHVLHFSARAREVQKRYGGSAPPIDNGLRQLGQPVPIAEITRFAYGERIRDNVEQVTVGAAYEGRWRNVGEMSFGLQKADYRKRVAQPGRPLASTHDEPWLFYGSAAAYLTPKVALYAGYTRGLEESGVAPDSAANRSEALPAIRTRQFDGGVRWIISDRWRVVAGGFQIEKPYFNNNAANVFTVLGDVRNRGVEVSVTGRPTQNLTLVGGAVLMQPRVTGEAVTSGRVGPRPVGQTDRLIRANVEYRLPFARGWSLEGAVANFGKRAASRSNRSFAPSYTLVDVGARYRFTVKGSPATFRVLAQNIGDSYVWNIIGDNSFGVSDRRRFASSLAIDF